MAERRPPQGGETYRAGPPKLGARLLAVASMVRPGVPVADIGCDHGKLAVHLALAGSPRVIAVDNRPLPLGRAAALVRQTGTGGVVECRLGDGLAPLAAGEAQDIVIAGLSGESMVQILEAGSWVRDAGIRLVLLPSARPQVLRRWLCEMGFFVEEEVPVAERGHYYSVMAMGYNGVARRPGALFCQVGRVPQTPGPAAAGYVAARLRNLKDRACAPLPEQEAAALAALIAEVETCLN